MRNRILLIALFCAVMVCPSWAATISESRARQVAAEFMSTHARKVNGGSMQLARKAPSINASTPAPYYVFNAGSSNDGFVIVAGDDRVPLVLGYSDQGSFDVNSVPEAMEEWLDGYAQQIAALAQGGKMAAHISSSTPILPMVNAVWSQNSPFNTMLPFLSNGKHAYVGCVATAMAQVMYYWKWPKRSEIVPYYRSETLGVEMPALPAVDFNWDAMQNTYLTSDSLSVEGRAAAQLSLYCAQAVRMDFLKNSSSAQTSDVPAAMSQYFGYSPNAKAVRRIFHTTQEWEQIILDELEDGRPVIYSGHKESSGHAFVCDGYDGQGRFHFNWGWNGKSNGYFLLNVLNPDLEGTGGAGGSYGYVSNQYIIAGLAPGGTYVEDLEVTVRGVEIQDFKRTRTLSSQDFTLTQATQFGNYMNDPIDFYYGWGLYQGNQLLSVLESGIKYGLPSWYYSTITSTLSFGSGITSGSYRILPIYKGIFEEEWTPCVGSGISFYEVIISGNNCTVIGHGAGMAPYYQVNNITATGNMHPTRPVDITLNVTNLGNTRNDIIYMFAKNELVAMGFVDLNKNENGNVVYRYEPEAVGTVDLKFTTDEEGNNVLATKTITINPMPAASLTGQATALNVTNAGDKIMTANYFGMEVQITNVGTNTYDEDITVKLYKRVYGTTGTLVQTLSQHLVLAPQETKKLTFHMDNVIDGWKYFAKAYYYSNAEQINVANVSTHTIIFPASGPIKGDVNKDGEVSIADVNAVIYMITKGVQDLNGDVNNDGEVTLADVNAVISIILAN